MSKSPVSADRVVARPARVTEVRLGVATKGDGLSPSGAEASVGPGSYVDPAARLVAILGVFLIAVAAVMLGGRWTQARDEPWRSTELTLARERLVADPKNEPLKQRVRVLDRDLRLRYFRILERNRVGAWLLLGSGCLLVVLARVGRLARVPTRVWTAPERVATRRRAGWTLGATGGCVALGMFAAIVGARVRLPDPVSGEPGVIHAGDGGTIGAEPTRGSPGPTKDELARNWPMFRGFDGSGRVEHGSLPLRWDLSGGDGIRWKAPVPLKGYSSPVVWNDLVFVTGGDREKRLVFAFEAGTGSMRWARPVTPTNAPAPVVDPPDQSGQAASTPATDGERVYAIFATGEFGALDFAGNLVWHQRLDVKENGYGYAASLVLWQDRLLVQVDQGAEEDGMSALLAYEARTGRRLWEAKRPVGGSWTTPLVVEAAGKVQVVTAGDPWLMAHDPRSGSEQWRAKVLGGELAPSPVLAGNRILAISPGHAFLALELDGTGDVTSTHVSWRLESEIPDVPTPSVSGDLVFTAGTEGHVYCREIGTGAKVWDHAFEVEIQASPLIVGDRLYLFGQPGNVWVTRVGRGFELLAEFEMGEAVFATPAVANGRLFVRTERQIVHVGVSSEDAKGEPNDAR